nr:hypothetical protein [Candidatus Atribacteria bacterium]
FNLTTNPEGETIGRFVLANSGEEGIKITSITTSVDYLIPLVSEIELNSGEKENLQVILLKDRIPDKIQEGEIKEYLYLTIAIPIVINR